MRFGLDYNNFWFLLFLAMWELVWKGLALYQAARRDERYWFAALLFFNTLGILPIVYLVIKQSFPSSKFFGPLLNKRFD